CQQGYTIPFTF
nr:immunoglobulin light chain junction region [Macaca mulatta]MOX25959.1 immunoglobulin light chain junction region [Macaca mulatta]MOX26359.1 immunoglobulin light chain junction region [Macaca mulatta]MOX26714.1 immunoglobulin light chain junction region [Macaca mulatta]MOX26841.1 immunoglobulin light chain junction region [Macaca mulatta]